MPIYEYECFNGHRIEVLQRLDAPGPERCATCGAPLHKLLARPAIVFKGSGWAKKDARASARTRSGKSDGDGKREDDKGEDGKGEDGKREDDKAAAGAAGGSAGGDTAASSGKERSSASADGGGTKAPEASTKAAPAGEAKSSAR